jgi:hypothetical protein
LVSQIDEGRRSALASKFEIEQSTVESQSLINVVNLERYVVETNCMCFSCFSHGHSPLKKLLLISCNAEFVGTDALSR